MDHKEGLAVTLSRIPITFTVGRDYEIYLNYPPRDFFMGLILPIALLGTRLVLCGATH